MAGVIKPLTSRAASKVCRLKNKKTAHTVRPARRAKFSRAAVKPERLSERPQGASCAEGSDRPFFQGADVGGCSFICFVSCLSGQEGNEDSNAAQSYRRKIEK